jgi:hypothetical protein
MWKTGLLAFGLTLSNFGYTQAPLPAKAVALASQLEPGEGLAIADPDGTVHLYGEATKEAPMGSLAKLAWLRLEGEDWAAMDVRFKCTGQLGPYHCWLPKGHGKVDLAKATQESCNLAFLAWAQMSVERWRRQLGEGAGRARLEDAFSPFLGNRMPPGDTIPEMTPDWVGEGELLRTSPEAMLRWLMDPTQEQLLTQCRRLFLGFFRETFQETAWWMKTGTGAVLSDPAATSAWVAGSNSQVIAVLHLPRGKGKAEGLARFRALMGIPEKH